MLLTLSLGIGDHSQAISPKEPDYTGQKAVFQASVPGLGYCPSFDRLLWSTGLDRQLRKCGATRRGYIGNDPDLPQNAIRINTGHRESHLQNHFNLQCPR